MQNIYDYFNVLRANDTPILIHVGNAGGTVTIIFNLLVTCDHIKTFHNDILPR